MPKLSLDGYTEAIYKANKFVPPPTDGSTITFFNTVKIPLFRCMCENVHADPSNVQPTAAAAAAAALPEMKDNAEMTAEQAERELEKNERSSSSSSVSLLETTATNVTWTTYSTNFKSTGEDTAAKRDAQTKEQVHNLIDYMNLPAGDDETSKTEDRPDIITEENHQEIEEATEATEATETTAPMTALLQESPESAIKVDLSQFSSEETNVLLNHVNSQVNDAKSALIKLQTMVSQQEQETRMTEIRRKQKIREQKLRESLNKELRGQLNGAMSARNTLDKCLEQLKVNGKPGKQWIKIRKLLAPTKPSQRCMKFKKFKFPVLKPYDWKPSDPPPTAGAKLKAIILTCLCTMHPATGHATIGMRAPPPTMTDATDTTTSNVDTTNATETVQKLKEDNVGTATIATSLLEEEPLTPATTNLDPAELAAKLEKIEQDKADVKNSMATVEKKLEKEENSFNKERKFKKEKIKLTVMKRKSNEKALKMFEEISKMATKRRLGVVRDCLKEIMGSGQNVLYWELRKLFAKTPLEAQCSVLKAFNFPILNMYGWKEKIVNSQSLDNPTNGEDQRPVSYRQLHVDQPPTDGSVVTEFGAGVKMSLFRCMCEERTIDETNTKDEEEEETMGGDEVTNDQGNRQEEPKLKNKNEAKEVQKIEKEEAKVDQEEAALENDPALKDLVV